MLQLLIVANNLVIAHDRQIKIYHKKCYKMKYHHLKLSMQLTLDNFLNNQPSKAHV